MPQDLCCDLCRSPSWPVWAPRLPTVPQNQNSNHIESTDHMMSPPSPSLTLMDPRYNKFWSNLSPISSRKIDVESIQIADNLAAVNTNVNISDRRFTVINGTAPYFGKNNNNNVNNKNSWSSMRLTNFNGPIMMRKNLQNVSQNHSNDKSNANDNVKISSKNICTNSMNSRMNSEACKCMEKKNFSPVLGLANQARAVSSPDPLHRPDTPKASLLSVTASQRLR